MHNYILLDVYYVRTRALCDSGTSRSCVLLDVVERLHLTPKPPVNDEPQYLLSTNKSKMVNLGTVDLNVAIQGLVFNFTFCVFETLSSPIILGYDFLVN